MDKKTDNQDGTFFKSMMAWLSDHGKLFFLLSFLLFASFAWSIYDDTVPRRTWKAYQTEFFRLERKLIKKQLKAARKDADSDSIKGIEKNLAKARADLKKKQGSGEYNILLEKRKDINIKFIDARQNMQFAKADGDENYYLYQHSFDEGHEYKGYKKKWQAKMKVVESMKPGVAKLETELAEIDKKIAGFNSKVKELEKELSTEKKKIERLETRLTLNAEKTPEIHQIVIKGLELNRFKEPVLTVDRCTSCHMGSTRKGFEKFPEPFRTHVNFDDVFKKHDSEKFGCTSCHNGQGSGLSFYDAGHSPKDKAQEEKWKRKYDYHPIHYWEKPQLAGDFIQSTCRRCHPQEEDIHGAPVLTDGIDLFRERLGCANCHLVEGYEDVNKIGPNLENVGSKVQPSWVFQWIKDPKFHHKKTRMPNFKLSDKEAVSIVAYLKSLNKGTDWMTHKLRQDIIGNKALIVKGRDLARSKGCNGCHTTKHVEVYKSKSRDIAPRLVNIGNKTSPDWILNWIMNPKKYSPKTFMPNLRLKLDEAEALVAYIYKSKEGNYKLLEDIDDKISVDGEAKKGLKLISTYGCYGCHNIPGTEKLGRVGAEMSNFGNKELYELAFGYAKNVHRSWKGYTKTKMQTPRIYETEVIKQKMPVFGLTEKENHALTVLLRGLRDEFNPKEFTKLTTADYDAITRGRKIIKKYNCIGCHEVEKNWLGANIKVPLNEIYGEKDAANYGPPVLIGQGKKVQSQWFYNFMFRPSTIRPWIKVTMPTFNFTKEQVNDVVRYFQSVSKLRVLYHFWNGKKETTAEEQGAKKLFTMLKCQQCHSFGAPVAGKKLKASELAPNLGLTKDRLRPEWVVDWLTDPQKLQPGTKMPNFFLTIDEDGEVTELLPKPKEKMETLKKYLFNLK